MDDLVAFVEQRLTEDELWAKAASAPRRPEDNPLPPGGVHWTWAVGDNWDPVDPDPLEPYIGGYDGQWSQPVTLRSVEEWTGSVGSLPLKIAESEELRTADGAHIVRHDPARVLREVEAKRRIIDRMVLVANSTCGQHDGIGVACEDVLRLLALPYADHPEHRIDWLPGADHG